MLAYLDWSTLNDAFRAVENERAASPEQASLRAIVEELAHCRTLALSPAHVAELLMWQPRERVLEMARWLDTLAATWVRAVNPDCDEELHSWLDAAETGAARASYRPFAGHLLAAYASISPVELGSSTTIEQFVRDRHTTPVDTWLQRRSVEQFQRLHDDRNSTRKMPQEYVNPVLNLQFRELLIQKALLPCSLGAARSERDVARLVDQLLVIPESIPFNRLGFAFVCALGSEILVQQRNSAGFASRYRGMAHDALHLVGGAYSAVFTCDERVDRAIDELREQFSRTRQLSVGGAGGMSQFVRRLSALCAETNEGFRAPLVR